MHTITVETAEHDDVKQGIVCSVVSHVLISSEEIPDPLEAEQVAGMLAMCVHGGMVTKITNPDRRPWRR